MKGAGHQYEDKLLEFAYGELPANEAAAVDAHVRGCPRCAEALAQITSVRSAMRQLPVEPAPDAGLESLLAYAAQTAERNAAGSRREAWWRRLLMPLASATALLVVGVVAWRASRDFDPDPGLLALKAQAPSEASAAPPRSSAVKKEAASVEVLAAAQGVAGGDGYGAAAPRAGAAMEAQGLAYMEDATADKEGARGKLAPAAPPPPPEPERRSNFADASRARQAATPAPVAARKDEPSSSDTASPNQRAAGNEPVWGLAGRLGTGPGLVAGSAEGAAMDAERAPAKEAPAPKAAPEKKASLSLGGLSTRGEALPEAEAPAVAAEQDTLRRKGSYRALADEAPGAAAASLETALAALRAGVTGGARAEALERVCEAYEARGQAAQARPYCDALVAEFPRSAGAQAVSLRRARREGGAASDGSKAVAPSAPAPGPAPAKAKLGED
jgi:anti-sigma factor RsiW